MKNNIQQKFFIFLVILVFTNASQAQEFESEETERKLTYLDKLPNPEVENFGRLFTLPQQRQFLDNQRGPAGKRKPVEIIANTQVPASSKTEVKPEVKLSGILLREDGRNMVWVNGQSELSPHKDDKVKAYKPKPGSLSVSVYSQQRSARLKPGQVWLLDERRVEEAYKVKRPIQFDQSDLRSQESDSTSTSESDDPSDSES